MNKVKILDREFQLLIHSNEIKKRVSDMAEEINNSFSNENVLFLSILNGAFMFSSDILRMINFPCEISFLKLASYQGTSTTGTVKRLIGINENMKDKMVVILEDIIDTGNTISDIVKQLVGYEPEQVKIVTLLFKRGSFNQNIHIDYVGFDVENEFLIGYGLDYNGYGRNLENIYKLV